MCHYQYFSHIVYAIPNDLFSQDCTKYSLLLVGTQQPHQLQCLAIQGKIVYASYQNVVKAFKRGQEVNTYLGHEGEVQFILPFGEHLVSIDDANVMKIWHSVSKGKNTTLICVLVMIISSSRRVGLFLKLFAILACRVVWGVAL